MAPVVALIVFLAGCAAILIFSALARGWRTAAALDQMSESEFDYTELFDNEIEPPEDDIAPPGAQAKAASRT